MDTRQIFKSARRNDLGEVKYYIENKNVSKSVQYNIAHIAAEHDYLDILRCVFEADPSIPASEEHHHFALLQSAVSNGALNVVKYLAGYTNSTVEENHFSRTILQRALEFGQLDILKYFIDERKFGTDWQTEDGMSIAQSAIKFDRFDILKYLIEEKNIDISDDEKKQLFALALQYQRFAVFKYLLKETKPDSRILNEYGPSILADAIVQRDLNFIKYVLDDQKVHINVNEGIDYHGKGFIYRRNASLLLHAVDFRCYDIAKYLIEDKKVDLTTHDKKGENVLFKLIENGNLDFVKYILDDQKAEIDINYGDNDGETILHLAVGCGHMDILKYLVEEKQADVNKPTKKYMETPLHRVPSKEICLYLIEHGARVDSKTVYGDTPLHYAVRKSFMCVDLIPCLLKHGADINQKNNKQLTPLNTVCQNFMQNGYYVNARYLIKSGADVNIGDENGKTPLYYVVRGWDVTAGYGRNKTEIWQNDKKLCQYLIKHGANPNLADKNGETLLDYMLRISSPDDKYRQQVCIYLIKGGASTNRTNLSDGNTLLHTAASLNLNILSKYLIKYGIDPNQRNHHGETPLHLAAASDSENACNLLMNYGADPQFKDSEGKTPCQRLPWWSVSIKTKERLCEKLKTRKRRNIPASSAEYWNFSMPYSYIRGGIFGEPLEVQNSLDEDISPYLMTTVFVGKFQSIVALLWLTISTIGFPVLTLLNEDNSRSVLE